MGAIISIFENFIVDIILFTIIFILLIVASVFAAKAADEVTDLDKWKKDPALVGAHSWYTRSAVAGWISVAGIAVLVGLYIFFGWESVEVTGKWIVLGFLALAIFLTLLTGILAAVGATQLPKSAVSGISQQPAYKDGIVATVTAIIGAVLILGIFLYRFFQKPKSKEEKAKEKAEKGKKTSKGEESDSRSQVQSLIESKLEEKETENRVREAELIKQAEK